MCVASRAKANLFVMMKSETIPGPEEGALKKAIAGERAGAPASTSMNLKQHGLRPAAARGCVAGEIPEQLGQGLAMNAGSRQAVKTLAAEGAPPEDHPVKPTSAAVDMWRQAASRWRERGQW